MFYKHTNEKQSYLTLSTFQGHFLCSVLGPSKLKWFPLTYLFHFQGQLDYIRISLI